MTRTVYATFVRGDESGGDPAESPKSFLDVVQGLKLDGPPDLSTRLHDYLYGDGDERR